MIGEVRRAEETLPAARLLAGKWFVASVHLPDVIATRARMVEGPTAVFVGAAQMTRHIRFVHHCLDIVDDKFARLVAFAFFLYWLGGLQLSILLLHDIRRREYPKVRVLGTLESGAALMIGVSTLGTRGPGSFQRLV
jgi:hypothetical protein